MSAPGQSWPSPRRALGFAVATSLVVTAVSYLAPRDIANTAVGGVFLFVAWWLGARGDTATVRAYGLSLGGLAEPEPLDARRIAKDSLRALGWALLFAAIFFPPFYVGFLWWWGVDQPFAWKLPADFGGRVMGQLLVIALPEEAFFRGYLQSALDGAWADKRRRILGAEIGPGLVVSCALFALGHMLTIPHPSRLAVFGPALLFGWLRARTGGIGAGVLFHALCNLYSGLLWEGFGLGS